MEKSIEIEITGLIQKNYKTAKINDCYVSDACVNISVEMPQRCYPYLAKRILAKYNEIEIVHFFGGFIDSGYTRGTISRWELYNDQLRYYKMFRCGKSEICRGDLGSMEKMYDTSKLSDKDMQSIVDEVESEMLKYREWSGRGEISEGVLDVLFCDILIMVLERRRVPIIGD